MSLPAPYAPFRPRAARWVAGVLASATGLGFVGLALVAPALGIYELNVVDRLLLLGFATLLAWFCYRQATVRAVPDREGITVRNLFLTTRLDWSEVVSVRFGGGRPWVQLDLADGNVLAVMGIQRADGALAQAEARRLATLVAAHEPRDR